MVVGVDIAGGGVASISSRISRGVLLLVPIVTVCSVAFSYVSFPLSFTTSLLDIVKVLNVDVGCIKCSPSDGAEFSTPTNTAPVKSRIFIKLFFILLIYQRDMDNWVVSYLSDFLTSSELPLFEDIDCVGPFGAKEGFELDSIEPSIEKIVIQRKVSEKSLLEPVFREHSKRIRKRPNRWIEHLTIPPSRRKLKITRRANPVVCRQKFQQKIAMDLSLLMSDDENGLKEPFDRLESFIAKITTCSEHDGDDEDGAVQSDYMLIRKYFGGEIFGLCNPMFCSIRNFGAIYSNTIQRSEMICYITDQKCLMPTSATVRLENGASFDCRVIIGSVSVDEVHIPGITNIRAICLPKFEKTIRTNTENTVHISMRAFLISSEISQSQE